MKDIMGCKWEAATRPVFRNGHALATPGEPEP
jgi:hypothetical protein